MVSKRLPDYTFQAIALNRPGYVFFCHDYAESWGSALVKSEDQEMAAGDFKLSIAEDRCIVCSIQQPRSFGKAALCHC